MVAVRSSSNCEGASLLVNHHTIKKIGLVRGGGPVAPQGDNFTCIQLNIVSTWIKMMSLYSEYVSPHDGICC